MVALGTFMNLRNVRTYSQARGTEALHLPNPFVQIHVALYALYLVDSEL